MVVYHKRPIFVGTNGSVVQNVISMYKYRNTIAIGIIVLPNNCDFAGNSEAEPPDGGRSSSRDRYSNDPRSMWLPYVDAQILTRSSEGGRR